MDQHTGSKWLIHGTKRHKGNTQLQAWNSPLEHPSRDCKHDINMIKQSEGSMFSPILKENVQGRKHPGSCAFPEPELLSYRKLKNVVQKVKNGHKNPNNSKHHDENHDEMPLSTRTTHTPQKTSYIYRL